MILETVTSSAIHAIGYDWEYRVLEIVFNSGGIYRYVNVPPDVYEGLVRSRSKGQYFQNRVRGRYDNWRLGRFRRRWQRTESAARKKNSKPERTKRTTSGTNA